MYAKKIYPAYVSKKTSNRVFILLVISNGEKLYRYLAVQKLSALLRGITSKHYGDFYCLNYPPSFETEKKLESHKKDREKTICYSCRS